MIAVNSIKNAFSIAKIEYVKWILSPRLMILLCSLIFINQFAAIPLLKMSSETDIPLNTFEPFIAIANSDVLMMLMPVVFMTLIADFPKNDGNLLFCVQRSGKNSWLCGQIIFLIYACVTFIFSIFVSTVICSFGNTEWSQQWSKTITDYTRMFPDNSQSFGALLIPENLYYQYEPIRSAINSAALMFLFLIFCGLLMLVFSELGKKLIGVGINVFLLLAGGASVYIDTNLKWIFPCSNAIVKLHFTKYFRRQIYELSCSYIFFAVLIAVLIILSFLFIRSADFVTAEED